ncbi:MAG: RsmD family RNA methyltransferase [Alphaproteobacteria bacterium]|nr:RsmD family RNA methyltransferase [Alphaproteobacteria bacterium]
MRIIGGKYRGKNLLSPQNPNVRPTSDRTREAIFNILRSKFNNNFSNLNLIELFCGSGAFSLEAISQGFLSVTAIDIDTSSVCKNAKLFPTEQSKINIIKGDVIHLPILKNKYNILFMDAPYKQNLTVTALTSIAKYLDNNALCIIELHKDETILIPANYQIIDERIYGIAKIIIARFIS